MDPAPSPIVETALPVHEVTDEEYLDVLDACLRVMDASGIPHCFIGGLAPSIYGRDRTTHDLDLFVRPEDADRTLKALAAGGFRVERSLLAEAVDRVGADLVLHGHSHAGSPRGETPKGVRVLTWRTR